MALPTTISNVTVGIENSYHGPFKSSGGAFYTILLDSVNVNLVEAHKATDPTVSFTEQDGANRPDFVIAVKSLSVFQDGDLLHIAGQNDDNDLYYARFDMATDTWVDLDPGAPVDHDILVDGAPTALAGCDITVLSTGKIRIVYLGERDMVMGSDFFRVDESHSTDGFTWSAPISVNANNDEVNYKGMRIVLPPSNSDQAHILYTDNTNLLQRAISSGDTLRTERDTGFDTTTNSFPITHGVGFLRSTVSKVRIGYREITTLDLEILEFDAFTADEDRAETSSNVGTDDVFVDNLSIVACLAVDGSTVHALMAKASDGKLYSADDQDSDTWTALAITFDTATIKHVSCNIYDRSGTKLAHIVNQSGTIIYDEDDLAAVSPSGVGAQTLAELTQSGVGVMQPSGAGAQALEQLLQSGVGVHTETVTGSGAQALAALLQVGVGVMQPSGVGVQTLAELIQAGIGVQIFTATGAQILAELLQSGVGVQIFTATGAQALVALLQAGVGVMQPSGSGAQALAELLQSGVGVHTEIVTGTGAQALAALLQAGVGVMQPSGSGVQTLVALLQAGVGVQIFTATGVQALEALLQSGVGVEIFTATGAQALAALLQAGVGVMQLSGSGAQALAALLQAGVGVMQPSGSGAQVLEALLQAGIGVHLGGATGTGAQILAALLQAGVGVMQPSSVGAQTLVALLQSAVGVQIFEGLVVTLLATQANHILSATE